MFHFITFHLRRIRESKTNSAGAGGLGGAKNRKSQQEKAKARYENQIWFTYWRKGNVDL